MHTTGSDGLGKPVVGIVLLIGKIGEPALDQTLRHRLGTDMHQPQLIQLVVLQVQLSAVQRKEQVLGPGHQQPKNGTLLFGSGFQNVFRFGSF